MSIHPTAIVDAAATIAETASIGPYCQVGPGVALGPDVELRHSVVVTGATEIGARTLIHPFSVIGGAPQHLGYRGDDTRLVIGADVVIREHVTINIGTVEGGGVTQIGDGGYFMTGAHIGHDCKVGDHVIFANNATLGGHVHVGNYAFLGGLCAVHQRCRIGDYAFLGGGAMVPSDVIPYASVYGNHARMAGLNVVGMKRRGVKREAIKALRGAYAMMFLGEGLFCDRYEKAREQYAGVPEVDAIFAFIDAGSPRSLMMAMR